MTVKKCKVLINVRENRRDSQE